jgi:hypothetical protein
MAGFQFTKATKSQAKARIAITGPAGSGKTYTALKIATAMGKRVALIDTEHRTARKYADEFDFQDLDLTDFHPNNYIGAIKAAEEAGFDVLVIDSASHEWSGKGGCLELVEKFAIKNKGGNKFAAWGDVTPLHNSFIEAIHSADLHIIATFRSKMDYVQTEGANGRTKIERVGMAPITREGAEYEFDIVGDLDHKHNMVITKTRCKALDGRVIELPGEDLAKEITTWLSDGAPAAPKPQPVAQPAQQPAATQPASATPTNGNGQPQAPNGNGQPAPKPLPDPKELRLKWQEYWDRADALGIPTEKRPTLPLNASAAMIVAKGRELRALVAQAEAAISGGSNGSK